MTFAREKDFEDALVRLLTEKCGWKDGVLDHPTEADLLRNWGEILFKTNRGIDRLGSWPPTEAEMNQLLDQVLAQRTPLKLNAFINGKTASIRREHPGDVAHLGQEVSLDIFDRTAIAGGKSVYQIARQPELPTPHPLASDRRGDIMLLINGMPVIHVELKRSGVAVGQATNQIEKYMKEGALGGIFSLIQVFVGMTPEESVYFANPGPGGTFNRDYFFHWTESNNQRVDEWEHVAEKLLSIPMAHQLIGYYSVADAADGVLKVLRPYQYYAARQIFDRVSKNESWEGGASRLGGYVWHTTGSGKTLTCFKAAQLITDMGWADKVVFLLDRRELGTQSLRDYRGFSGEDPAASGHDSEVQATENTRVLVAKLTSNGFSDKLIVTSIQKMSRIRDEEGGIGSADIEKMRSKRIVIIVDEAHRDVTGDMLYNIKKTFPEAMFFGFTGTPKLKEGADPTTADVFGDELHRYTLADGIRDKNVLGFDPVMVPTYKDGDLRKVVALDKAKASTEAEALGDSEKKAVFLKWMNPADTPMTKVEAEVPPAQYTRKEHQETVVKDIADHWTTLSVGGKFHALLATASIPEAIDYYRLLRDNHPEIKTTALFDPSIDNNGGTPVKETAMLEILDDYNRRYGMSFTVPSWDLFKKDVASRLAHKGAYVGVERTPEKQLDLLVVVDQMLTGYDSKWLNTLYLDKMRDEDNLIQAFSRTNRLFGPDKPFGSIRYYRKPHTMAKNMEEALKLYSGDRPFALYVDRLETNLNGMNQKFDEISAVFAGAGITDFKSLPPDLGDQGCFAKLFGELNDYLYAAKIQGFRWDTSIYTFHHESDPDTCVTMKFDARVYGILVQRYKELATGGGGTGGSAGVPFAIDPYLTEIDIGIINAAYMDSKFKQFVKELKQKHVTPGELADLKKEVHSSFAGLSREDQRFAEMLLDDIASGNITLESGLTLQDYIARYKTRALNRSVEHAVDAFGLNRQLLERILASGTVTDANLNEYGRFDRLLASVDRKKAKPFLEKALGESLSIPDYNAKITAMLKEFLLGSGKDGTIPGDAASAGN